MAKVRFVSLLIRYEDKSFPRLYYETMKDQVVEAFRRVNFLLNRVATTLDDEVVITAVYKQKVSAGE